MPHSLSAKKRVRQNVARQEHNRVIKSRLRTARRAFAKAVEAGDLDAAQQRLLATERLLHRAAANGPVHRNTAGRTIGRMQLCLNKARQASAAKA
jgi:small subunit ribosomal protein S20